MVLFQLDKNHGADAALLVDSRWRYMDDQGQTHGPYTFLKMLAWARKGAFPRDCMPVQHANLLCWIPLWTLPALQDLLSGDGSAMTSTSGHHDEDEVMIDAEAAVEAVRQARGDEARCSSSCFSSSSSSHQKSLDKVSTSLEDFAGLSDQAAAAPSPMDYELSSTTVVHSPDAAKAVRAFVIVDTSVLLSHLTFTERVFTERLTSAAPAIEAVLVIPWVVLCELDRLKDAKGRPPQAAAARRALARIRILSATRDAVVRVQSASEHEALLKERDRDPTASRELRNDDLIMRTCWRWLRGPAAALQAAGHRAAALLLSNDKGLCVRAAANGTACFTSGEFPSTPNALSAVVVKESEKIEASTSGSSLPNATSAVPFPTVDAWNETVTQLLGPGNGGVHDSTAASINPPIGVMHNNSGNATGKALNAGGGSPNLGEAARGALEDDALSMLRELGLLKHDWGMNDLEGIHLGQHQHQQQEQHQLGPGFDPQRELSQGRAQPQTQALPPHHSHTARMDPRQLEAHLRKLLETAEAHSPSTLQPSPELDTLIPECLGPAVAFFRQQDLGSLWLELLQDEYRPPWDAAGVLAVLSHHGTTFWNLLPRSELETCKQLERGLRTGKVPPATAATELKPVVQGLLAALEQGRIGAGAGVAPDPGDVPGFVSLGEAKAALEDGMARLAVAGK
jgi:rRNA-processing protein FCF1